MIKRTTSALFFTLLLTIAAQAGDPLGEGRSSSCSNMALVCAVMKDGTVKPTSECDVPQQGVARVLSGDCYDED